MLLKTPVVASMRQYAGKDLISMADLSKEEIEEIILLSSLMKKKPHPSLLQGHILASCFFEPSTRTRLSFEAAMHRLGGSVIGFADGATTSAQKGEPLSDTMRVIGDLADVIAIRHSAEGSARVAAEATETPVINAGDGANQHPTQTLLDLFTIHELFGKIDGLHIAITGDLKYARAVHSLAMGLSHYSVRLYFIAPQELTLPEEIAEVLRKAGVKVSYHAEFLSLLPKLDIVYLTRRQKERGDIVFDKALFTLEPSHLKTAKETLRVMCPMPRMSEISTAVDALPQAVYFEQAANGVFVRQAILSMLLGKAP